MKKIIAALALMSTAAPYAAQACSMEPMESQILAMPYVSSAALDVDGSEAARYMEDADEFHSTVVLMTANLAQKRGSPGCKITAFEIDYDRSKVVHEIKNRMYVDVSPVKVTFECQAPAGATKLVKNGKLTLLNSYFDWDRNSSCYGQVSEEGMYLYIANLRPDLKEAE